VGAVGTDLTAYAATAESMPADVAERLDGLLSTPQAPATAADPVGAGAGASGTAGRSRGRPAGVPDGRSSFVRPPARRRWSRWAVGVGVAAALAAGAGVSISWLGQQGFSTATDNTAGSGSAEKAGPAVAADAAGMRVSKSGRDYTRESIAAVPAPLMSGLSPRAAGSGAAPDSGDNRGQTGAGGSAALGRLDDPSALSACLDAIAVAHGRGAVDVQSVDFGAFEGKPAIVVFFTDAAGERWGWASGGNCGVAGADELYRTRVA
jgi:hypothetical protein